MAQLRTFVFTDLVGSVDLKREMRGASDAERDAAYVAEILAPHGERIESMATDLGGRVVSTAGDGHFLVFGDAASAARWAIAIQQSHFDSPLETPEGTIAQVRISLHLGSPQIDPRDENNFIGKAVDYAARLNDYAAGGQMLVSRAARVILEDAGLNGIAFHAHGNRELKGIGSVEVHELLFDGHDPRATRREPREEKPRDWTVNPGITNPPTVTYSKLAGQVPVGQVPASAVAQRLTRLGNYELGDLVGAGGMGDVFQARHSQFGRLRAVKVIKPHLVAAGQQEVVRRFYQEIKAIGGLEHPNIVVAIDSSTPNDQTHYLVMEYLHGSSASDLVDRFGPLTPANACEIARQTATGLDYIDRQGMVHRDIKPSNLMVTQIEAAHLPGSRSGATSQPLVKILDLGLALLVGDNHERLTRLDHRAMGTAMYMSPEQWRTTSVDIRSDIYSLGCTLYHLLSGKPPFFDSDLRPEKAHQKSRLPTIRGEGVPKPVWIVLRKMLAKNPDERYQSPAELAEALAPLSQGNTLVDLVEESLQRPAGETTQAGDAIDTLAGNAAPSDTRLAGPRVGSSLTPSAAPSRRWLLVAGSLLAASVAAGAWFATDAARRRVDLEQSQQEVVAARRESFLSLAHLRASHFASQADDRFRLLESQSKRATLMAPTEVGGRERVTLQEYVARVAKRPEEELLWKPLQSWIVGTKESFDEEAPADSWFIVGREGTQVARAPYSKSVGKNYAYRNYFHGQQADLPQGTTDARPIDDSNLSAVYRSTSTRKLKVAFSVPIWNGRSLASARRVVGVLAMSVDLGDFRVLNRRLSGNKEVLLVNLREDHIDGDGRRGLLLHHQDLENQASDEPPPRLTPSLVARIDEALATNNPILVDYPDPLRRTEAHYWGAIETVVIVRRGTGKRIDTHWLVIVQEKLPN